MNKENLFNKLSRENIKSNHEEQKDYQDNNNNGKETNKIDKAQDNIFNPDNQGINKNNIENINDENFFNFSFYNNKPIKNNDTLCDTDNYNINQNKNHNEILKKYNNDNQKLNNEISKCNNNEKNNKKTKKILTIKEGDWICLACNNLNFSFRTTCNRCGLSKILTEYKKRQLQIMNQQKQIQLFMMNRNFFNPYFVNKTNINNVNSNYFLNSNPFSGRINVIYCPIIFNNYYYINKFGNYNNYQIYNPCNVNIKS